MSHYPKWLYHKDQEAKIVQSKEEHESLGKGWEETPFKLDKKQTEKTEEQKTDKDKDETYREHMAKWESKEEKSKVAAKNKKKKE